MKHFAKSIKEIVDALNPVKATIEHIYKQETNLIQADSAFNLLLSYLKNQNIQISYSLYTILVSRLNQWRTDLSDLLKFLHTGKMDSKIHENLNISALSRAKLPKMIHNIVKKTFDELACFSEDESDNEQIHLPKKY